MTDDRSEMQEARNHGLKARHETREARAVRKAVAEEIAQAIQAARIERHWNFVAIAAAGECAAIAREIGSRDPA